MANETWQPVTTTYIETRTQDERKYGVTAIIHCDEPLDIAICRRVPDRPITPEALEASGWNKSYNAEHGWFINVHPRHIIRIDFAAEIIGEFAWVTVDESRDDIWRMIEIPNCRTMQQLAALVELLGGDR